MSTGNDLTAAVDRLGLGRVGEVLAGFDAWIVGGVARALIAGTPPDADVDIAVDAELEPILERLGLPAKRHDRFGTAVVDVGDGRHADIARTRVETYAAPGALPDVAPAPIEDDLGRRDFTVNAIAIGVAAPHPVLDPFGGGADLAAGTLRVLHDGSFTDDPTRAIRGARYCARLGLEPDPVTRRLLAAADLGNVTRDRRDAELRRLASEHEAARGFRLLGEWGVLPLAPGAGALLDAVAAVRSEPPWAGHAEPGVRATLIAAGVVTGLEEARRLAAARPERPSEGVELAAGTDPAVLLVARAAGGAWIERYLHEWSEVRLEIDGDDLLGAGIARGPAVGAGLGGALRRKLDGELESGREAELEAALEIARRSG
jgi:tRNA nucleotidyltransferase (CCA-adding enzyme)